jgi:RNA polymerase sigma-70 factor (ECF subfamily)
MDTVECAELERILGEIVGNLPERCRVIFLMAHAEGLKSKEIAERLSISESTVRVQIKIAVDRIKKGIGEHYPELTWALALLPFIPLP